MYTTKMPGKRRAALKPTTPTTPTSTRPCENPQKKTRSIQSAESDESDEPDDESDELDDSDEPDDESDEPDDESDESDDESDDEPDDEPDDDQRIDADMFDCAVVHAAVRGIEAVVEVIRRHLLAPSLKSGAVLERACWALSTITIDDHNSSQLEYAAAAAAGVAGLMVQIINRYPNNDALLKYACKVLINITLNQDTIEACGAAGGVEAVIELMKSHREGAVDLLMAACGVLTSITESAANAAKCTTGVGVVMDIIKRCIKQCKREMNCKNSIHAALLEEACCALSNITTNITNKVACGVAGVKLMVKVIKTHTYGESLLMQACSVLANLTLKNNANKAACGEVGGTEALVEVIKAHRTGPSDLLQNACLAIGRIAINDDNEALCGEAGGPQLLVDIIETHSTGPPELLRDACFALNNITVNAANEARCGTRGVGAMVGLIKRFFKEPSDVLRNACEVLGNIVFNDDNNASCSAVGGIDVVVAVINQYNNKTSKASCEDAVLKSACRALNSILGNSSHNNQALCGKSGGVEAALKLIKHNDNYAVQQQACHMLFKMVQDCASNKKRFADAQGARVMAKLIKHGNPALRNSAIDVLSQTRE